MVWKRVETPLSSVAYFSKYIMSNRLSGGRGIDISMAVDGKGVVLINLR